MDKPTNWIKEMLDKKGIIQTWLAEQLGKSFAMVYAYVGNHHRPRLETIAQIADILQINPKDLIVFVDKKTMNQSKSVESTCLDFHGC